jgi:hypothetical protein
MRNLRPMSEREENLIRLYAHCSLGMTPQRFYAKWDVDHEDIALICARPNLRSLEIYCESLVWQGSYLPLSYC